MSITTAERKQRVSTLREEHEAYFIKKSTPNALYIPKMAYRPSGKDELHVSFFPSELEKEHDIYTEFVSIDYVSEDPKRTLYLIKYNPHWKSEFELVTSNSGFVRHFIPVSELKVINDITSRNLKPGLINTAMVGETLSTLFDLPDPDSTESSSLVDKLEEINQTLITLTKVINKFNK
tara:strand:+ start:373 stop:906 length:534 start_codon:yes stop_codon:yes gene_type:complete